MAATRFRVRDQRGFSKVIKRDQRQAHHLARNRQAVTEPSAVAPDAKVNAQYLGFRESFIIRTDSRIRRYHARFCKTCLPYSSDPYSIPQSRGLFFSSDTIHEDTRTNTKSC